MNEEDPIKARLVDDAIAAALAEANRQVARALTRANLRYLELLLNGGDVTVFGNEFNVLGLRRIGQSRGGGAARAAARSPERRDLDRVVRFTRLAQANFGLSSQVLQALSEPIRVDKQVVSGARGAAHDLRRRGRGGGLADVRDRAAGVGRAGARARPEHVRPARARAGLAHRRCWSRRGCSRSPARCR